MTVSHSRVNFSPLPGPTSQKPPKPSQHPFPYLSSFLFFWSWQKVNSSQRHGDGEGKKYWTEVHILVVDCEISHDPPPWKVILQVCFLKRWSLHTFQIDSLWPNLNDAEITYTLGLALSCRSWQSCDHHPVNEPGPAYWRMRYMYWGVLASKQTWMWGY